MTMTMPNAADPAAAGPNAADPAAAASGLTSTPTPLSPRKSRLRAMAEHWAWRRNEFIERNAAFHQRELEYLRFLVPEGQRVLEIGSSTGRLLAGLKPSHGVGVEIAPAACRIAQESFPHLTFVEGDAEDPRVMAQIDGVFDFIIIADTIGLLDDCQSTLTLLHRFCHADTRLIVAYHSPLWEATLKLGERLGLRIPQPQMNWLRPADIDMLVTLARFEPVRREWRELIPKRLFGIGTFINRYIATLPLIRHLCLRHYLVSRPAGPRPAPQSVTVLVPCRNERGNIEPILQRLPAFAPDMEILFVEGNSKDGTFEEIQRVIPLYPHRDIKAYKQDGKGKGDAVRKGFGLARGEVLMILDADMTVPPEDLPKFWQAICDDSGEFINGTRLVYPMENEAMRFLNRIANHGFSFLFSWLLNQRFTDTLCGTKVLRKRHYELIAANRHYFGDFDPFGDFDLIFGASKLSLKITELPIRYAARTYGETQISRFVHGWLLLRMVVFAWRKLKAI